MTLSNIDEHIGQKLRELRIAAGYNMRMMGEAVGVSYQQISKYEAGIDKISAARLWLFAAILEVKITDFFRGLPDPKLKISI